MPVSLRMKKHLKVLFAGLLIAPAIQAQPETTGFDDRRAAAREASTGLLEELSGELMKAMQEGGPANAVFVCRDLAPAIAGELSRQYGWQVTRVGTRVRNPMLGMPDAWERETLQSFSSRQGDGEALAGMEHDAVVEVGDARYYRYMRAIPVQPACLTCHGSREQIPTPVLDEIDEHYPHDRAVDYAAGELRGAVSIMQPLDIPLDQPGQNSSQE